MSKAAFQSEFSNSTRGGRVNSAPQKTENSGLSTQDFLFSRAGMRRSTNNLATGSIDANDQSVSQVRPRGADL